MHVAPSVGSSRATEWALQLSYHECRWQAVMNKIRLFRHFKQKLTKNSMVLFAHWINAIDFEKIFLYLAWFVAKMQPTTEGSDSEMKTTEKQDEKFDLERYRNLVRTFIDLVNISI